MMTYPIKIRKRIHGSLVALGSTDVYVEKKIELPYPPFVGLELGWKTLDGKTAGGAVIETVYYKSDIGETWCYDQEDKELYDLHNTEKRPIREIVEEYVADGWEVDRGKYARQLGEEQ